MTRVWIAWLGAAGMLATGCQKNETPTAHTEEPYQPAYEMPAPDTDGQTLATLDAVDSTDSATTYSTADVTPVETEATAANDEPLTPTGGRVYVVQKGDTLYKLARRFYNDQSRWRDIWEANRTRVPDPDRLRVGMKLIIP